MYFLIMSYGDFIVSAKVRRVKYFSEFAIMKDLIFNRRRMYLDFLYGFW